MDIQREFLLFSFFIPKAKSRVNPSLETTGASYLGCHSFLHNYSFHPKVERGKIQFKLRIDAEKKAVSAGMGWTRRSTQKKQIYEQRQVSSVRQQKFWAREEQEILNWFQTASAFGCSQLVAGRFFSSFHHVRFALFSTLHSFAALHADKLHLNLDERSQSHCWSRAHVL